MLFVIQVCQESPLKRRDSTSLHLVLVSRLSSPVTCVLVLSQPPPIPPGKIFLPSHSFHHVVCGIVTTVVPA